jgi:hypothetical protein
VAIEMVRYPAEIGVPIAVGGCDAAHSDASREVLCRVEHVDGLVEHRSLVVDVGNADVKVGPTRPRREAKVVGDHVVRLLPVRSVVKVEDNVGRQYS